MNSTNIPGIGKYRVKLIKLGDSDPGEVQWIWYQWIPRDEVSLLTGDPGASKGLVLTSLSTTVASGGTLPDGQIVSPHRVLYIAGDDSVDEIHRRLRAQGFEAWDNFRVVSQVDFVGPNEEPKPSWLQLDMTQHLAALVNTHHTDFPFDWMIIDPLINFNKQNQISSVDIRQMMARLVLFARKLNIAITGTMHLNKDERASSIYRASGSMQFVATARAELRVEELNSGLRKLYVNKANLSAKPTPLAYTIMGDRQVIWQDYQEPLDTDAFIAGEKRTKVGAAKELITCLLVDGSKPADEVRQQAKLEGIGWATMNKAKKEMGVESRKLGPDGPWVWEYPETVESCNLPFETADKNITLTSEDEGTGEVTSANHQQ